MATAPTVPNFAQYNYEIGDTADVVIKQNGLNGALLQFGSSLTAMTESINTDLQTMEQQKTDTQQAATAAGEAAQQIALDKQAVADDRTHIDQQKGIVDTKTQQVSNDAQQVATDKQAVATDTAAAVQAATDAGAAAGASVQAKDAAQALYGDLNAVDTAKTEAQQAATTASEERGLAVTARQGAEAARDKADQTTSQAIAALKQEEDPFTQYAKEVELGAAAGRDAVGEGALVSQERVANPNLIVDGDFRFWFEGDSQTNHGYGSDTIWGNWHSGATKVHSKQQFALGQSIVPGKPKYFSRTQFSEPSTKAAGDYCLKTARIEGVETLSGQTCTLSFWAASDVPRDIAIEFVQGFGTGGSPSASVQAIGVTTVSLTTTLEKYSVTVDIPTVVGKTIGTGGNDNLQVMFWFFNGTTHNSRTNNLGYQSGTVDLAHVKLEEGSVATEGGWRNEAEELALVQRYYEEGILGTYSSSSSRIGGSVNFNCAKRAPPAVSFSELSSLGKNISANVGPGNTGFYWATNPAGLASNTYSFTGTWIADARL